MPIPDDATIEVFRFELHPLIDSTHRVVGFGLRLANGRESSFMHSVPLEVASDLTDEQVRDLALGAVEPDMEDFAARYADAPGFVGEPIAGADARPIRSWAQGATYAVDDHVTHEGALYRCTQAHTADAGNWTPDQTPALWNKITDL